MPVNKGSATDQAYLRIYTSTMPTDYRITTICTTANTDCQLRGRMSDITNRHASYYIGSVALAATKAAIHLNYLLPGSALYKGDIFGTGAMLDHWNDFGKVNES